MRLSFYFLGLEEEKAKREERKEREVEVEKRTKKRRRSKRPIALPNSFQRVSASVKASSFLFRPSSETVSRRQIINACWRLLERVGGYLSALEAAARRNGLEQSSSKKQKGDAGSACNSCRFREVLAPCLMSNYSFPLRSRNAKTCCMASTQRKLEKASRAGGETGSRNCVCCSWDAACVASLGDAAAPSNVFFSIFPPPASLRLQFPLVISVPCRFCLIGFLLSR